MKKLLQILGLILIIFIFTESYSAEAQTATPVMFSSCVDVVEDYNCGAYVVHGGKEECSRTCSQTCIDQGKPCLISNPCICSTMVWEKGVLVIDEKAYSDSFFKPFGLDFGPADQAVPRLIRISIFGAFSLIGLVSIVFGLSGLIQMTTAVDNAEKFEAGAKTLKNAVIGTALAFGSVIIVQIAALLTGMEQNLFNFYLIPKQGKDVEISERYAKDGPCLPDQTGTTPAGTVYTCVEGRWK